MAAWAAVRERVWRRCAAGGADRALRADLLREIAAAVPFDAYVWVGTDPVTGVGAAPLAEIPVLADLPRVVRLRYLAAPHRWTALDGVATGVGDGPWAELLAGYGVRDVASAALRDRFGIWAFLDLWRGHPFTPAETEFLATLLPDLTGAVRAAVAATFVAAEGQSPSGPVVLTLSDDLTPRAQTPSADAQLRALLPTPADRPPVPAIALNAAAQLLAVEAGIDDHPPSARTAHGPGRWISARAARLGPAVAVTLERATPAERLDVYARALGLTGRETEVVGRLVAGADTRTAARALGIAEHTVNDHLKSVFAKAGTNSRRQLVANAVG